MKVIVAKMGASKDPSPYGLSEEWVAERMGIPFERVHLVKVNFGEKLPDPSGFAGAVLLGSNDHAYDDFDWIHHATQWMREARANGLPMLNICFSHQLFAMANGGKCEPMGKGIREIGGVIVHLTEQGKKDPLFNDMPDRFEIVSAHEDTVTKLPEGAVLLAKNEMEPHHAFRLDKSCYSVQFHPEFVAEHIARYAVENREKMEREGRDVEKIVESCRDTPWGIKIMQNFQALLR